MPSSRRPARSAAPAPKAESPVVDLGFVATRARLIDVAAFLDRVERHGAAGDFRCKALREALKVLADGRPGRARRILEKLSDPTTTPGSAPAGSAACGAWRPKGK